MIANITFAQGRYFYVSNNGNDANNGTSITTPWQTIEKVNTHLANNAISGDVILFKRGEVFTTKSPIRITKSGIALGAYGTGNLPEITGFTTVSNWTASPGRLIYSSVVSTNKPTNYPVNLNTAPINMVSINGVPQVLGRTPNITDTNGGYRNFDVYRNTSGAISTDSAGVKSGKIKVRLSPMAPQGAFNRFTEVVFRPTEWNVYRAKIDTINIIGGDTLVSYRRFFYIQNGVSVASSGIDTASLVSLPSGWGYFYQNDSTFLDQFGEWHYDYPTGRLRVYFGTQSPTNYNVRIATADTLVNVIGRIDGINISDIKFTGSNLYGILYSNVSTNVQNCEFSQIGGQAIGLFRPFNTTIRNNKFSDCMQAGIYSRVSSVDSTQYMNLKINSNEFKRIAIYPGMGSYNQGLADYAGISAATFRNTEIDSNIISRTGGDGINFQGSDISIGYNFIDSFCSVYQDHGAIYTYMSPGNTNSRPFTNRRIHHNFINNSMTAPGGTPYKRVSSALGTWKRLQRVNGIYGDGTSDNLLIDSNIIWKINARGFIFNGPTNVDILDNFYMADTTTTKVESFASEDDITNKAIAIRDFSTDTASDVTIKRNIFYLFTPTQDNFSFEGIRSRPNIPPTDAGIYRWIRQVGTIDSNYVNLVTIPNVRCTTNTTYSALTLQQMQDSTSQNKNAIALDDATKDRIIFYPNYSKQTISIFIKENYKNIKGVIQQGTITIPPYSYYFGIFDSPMIDPINGVLLKSN